MYKLLFIDEEKETLEDFEEYVDNFPAKQKLIPYTAYPLPNLEEMIAQIFKMAPDALIVDYRLNEMKIDISYNVPYNGVDLVNEFQAIRKDFPCFVLTALDDEAVSQSDDVNIVYVKNLIYKEEGKAKAKFLDRVSMQIEHYKASIHRAKEELSQLIKLRASGKADMKIENRIIELDSFLEKSIDAKNAIPSEFKSLSNSSRLDSILHKVDTLLKKIEDEDN